jgi:hypothetical protein
VVRSHSREVFLSGDDGPIAVPITLNRGLNYVDLQVIDLPVGQPLRGPLLTLSEVRLLKE